MTRHGGPAGADGLDQVAHAALAATQRLDDLQPRGMTEGLEYGGALPALLGGDDRHVADYYFVV